MLQKEAHIWAMSERFGTTTLHSSIALQMKKHLNERSDGGSTSRTRSTSWMLRRQAGDLAWDGKLFVQDQNYEPL